jgi:hypothetical protein
MMHAVMLCSGPEGTRRAQFPFTVKPFPLFFSSGLLGLHSHHRLRDIVTLCRSYQLCAGADPAFKSKYGVTDAASHEYDETWSRYEKL